MLKRYSYRAYPTAGQARASARAFGCARVVFNDFLRARDDLYSAGRHKDVPFSETVKDVTTRAKLTVERQWLSEVSNTVLQQSVRDAERSYRNWFDSLSGKRRGRRVGHPRFKSRKQSRQSVRFTRNCGFSVRETTHGVGFVRLPKIGHMRFALSRRLPNPPSSVTLTHQPDGRWYVSFVVDVPAPEATPAPERTAGIDAGIGDDLAAITYSDGTREKIANPRHLRSAQRRLAKAGRALSRTQKGSNGRAKARLRLARAHRRIADARLDHHHKLADRLVRENSHLAIEDLSLSGMGQTRLAKSVADASIGTLYLLIRDKAETQGRTVATAGRWEPTTQTCSVCGAPGGRKPLSVRVWQCGECRTVLDRDYNAGVNIIVAAGLAETLNAGGGSVRRRLAVADPVKPEPTERMQV